MFQGKNYEILFNTFKVASTPERGCLATVIKIKNNLYVTLTNSNFPKIV